VDGKGKEEKGAKTGGVVEASPVKKKRGRPTNAERERRELEREAREA
jgi:hypothetical protein